MVEEEQEFESNIVELSRDPGQTKAQGGSL